MEWIDDDRDEIRYCLLGDSEGRIFFVSCTERNERYRIISARRATRHERNRYDEQN